MSKKVYTTKNLTQSQKNVIFSLINAFEELNQSMESIKMRPTPPESKEILVQYDPTEIIDTTVRPISFNDKLLKELVTEKNVTVNNIARYVGCANQTIYSHMKKVGIPYYARGGRSKLDE